MRIGFTVLALACAACTSAPRVSGGNGGAIDAALVISGARTLEEQNQAMLDWIGKNVPDGKLNRSESRYVLSSRGVFYAAQIDTSSGGPRVVYFDITDLPPK